MARYDGSIADRAKAFDCDAELTGRPKAQIEGIATYKDDFVSILQKLYDKWGDAAAADAFIAPFLKDLGS